MHILIIDDDRSNTALFSHMLEMLDGVTPHAMHSAQEALLWCRDNEPDLILVDYMMPGMDGLDFLRAFRELPVRAAVPVVMVTADVQHAVRHEALRRGANDFLTKPLNFVELNARVGNLLALRRAQLQLAERAETLAEAVRKATEAIAAREREAIYRLSRAAEFRDPDTGSHLLRMAAYSALIALHLGLPEEQCVAIHDAAPMHDIGKLGIPDAILLKPGRLSVAEMETMRSHPRLGASILADSESPLLQLGAVIALTHHERYDGQGYPDGLAGTAIPLPGRIVAVADVYDALTSQRPYKQAWTHEQAREAIEQQSGGHFDPACVEALFRDPAALEEIRSRLRDDDSDQTKEIR
ncbi:HD-GYP domain-containing protein [Oxalobacteraceae bacterium A2-2]